MRYPLLQCMDPLVVPLIVAQLRRGMWDISSPTRDLTLVPCNARQILNHQTAREASKNSFFFFLRIFFSKYIFIYVFLAALSLRFCSPAFSSCSEQGLLLVRCSDFSLRWLLLLQSTGSKACRLQQLQLTDWVVVVPRLSCLAACGIFWDWQVDS